MFRKHKTSRGRFIAALPMAICLAISGFGYMGCRTQSNPETAPSSQSTKDRAAYDSMHFLLAERYDSLGAEGRRSLHALLKQSARWSYDVTCPQTEPGVPLVLFGKLTNERGEPLVGVDLHVFQTDSKGYYAPPDAAFGRMSENDPRLEGFMVTDSAGRFEIRTIRPANYPRQYNGRTIPQHIHVVAEPAGYEARNVQVVFEDDPVMDHYWLDWARRLDFPVVHLSAAPKGGYTGNLLLQLKRK